MFGCLSALKSFLEKQQNNKAMANFQCDKKFEGKKGYWQNLKLETRICIYMWIPRPLNMYNLFIHIQAYHKILAMDIHNDFSI